MTRTPRVDRGPAFHRQALHGMLGVGGGGGGGLGVCLNLPQSQNLASEWRPFK